MQDAKGVMDKAMDAPKGIRVQFATQGQALRLRQRCYTARDRERQASRRVYDESDLRYGTTPWDTIMFAVKQEGNDWYLYLTHDPEEAANLSYKMEEL